MTGNTGSIYNSTDGPLIIDRAGRVLGAREHRDDVDLDASPVAGHISAGRIVVTSEAKAETTDADTAPKGGKQRRTTPTHEEA